MWQDAVATAGVISTDATGAMIQPEERQDGQRQSCKKGHFFTAIVDCDHVLFAYTEHHTQEAVRRLFGEFKGFLQSDASNVYDILERGPPKDEDTDDYLRNASIRRCAPLSRGRSGTDGGCGSARSAAARRDRWP